MLGQAAGSAVRPGLGMRGACIPWEGVPWRMCIAASACHVFRPVWDGP